MVQNHINSKVNSLNFFYANSVTVRKRMIDKDFLGKFLSQSFAKIDDSDENYREIEEWLSINLEIVSGFSADFGHGLVRKKRRSLFLTKQSFSV